MKKSEKTRQMIIEKAAVLFNTKGYAGTSIQDIMTATGLTKGGIYGNFKKGGNNKKGVKEEIALAAFAHSVAFIGEQIRYRTTVISNSVDKLKGVVYFYKERVLCWPIEGGCPIMNTAIEVDDGYFPALKGLVVKAFNYWRKGIIRVVERGIERGEIKEDVSPEDIATLFIGMLEGGVLISRLHNDNEQFGVMAEQLLSVLEEIRLK